MCFNGGAAAPTDPMYKNKAWKPYLCLFPTSRFWFTVQQEQTITPTPICTCTPAMVYQIHTDERLLHSCLGL